MSSLDKTDRRILTILQSDGRITNADLASRVGIPATSMSDRFRRLQRDGYITGFFARLDPQLIGFDLLVFIEVPLNKTTPDVFAKFAQAVRRAPEVIECHMAAGGFDYLIKRASPPVRRMVDGVKLLSPSYQERFRCPAAAGMSC